LTHRWPSATVDNRGYSDIYAFASQDHVVVTVGTTSDKVQHYTAVLATRDGTQRWLETAFDGRTLAGEVVAGQSTIGSILNRETIYVGRSATTGRQLWHIDTPDRRFDLYGLGSSGLGYFLAIPGRKTSTYLVELATGKVVKRLDGGNACWHNGETIIVCVNSPTYDFDEHLFAYDVTTAKVLWELPDKAAGRVAPSAINAVRRGALYVTTENGPMILDTRTGQDLVAKLPFEPEAVTASYALLRTNNGALVAYPATA
jgi:outer membrane protein assembly factor BamB